MDITSNNSRTGINKIMIPMTPIEAGVRDALEPFIEFIQPFLKPTNALDVLKYMRTTFADTLIRKMSDIDFNSDIFPGDVVAYNPNVIKSLSDYEIKAFNDFLSDVTGNPLRKFSVVLSMKPLLISNGSLDDISTKVDIMKLHNYKPKIDAPLPFFTKVTDTETIGQTYIEYFKMFVENNFAKRADKIRQKDIPNIVQKLSVTAADGTLKDPSPLAVDNVAWRTKMENAHSHPYDDSGNSIHSSSIHNDVDIETEVPFTVSTWGSKPAPTVNDLPKKGWDSAAQKHSRMLKNHSEKKR